MVRIAVSKLNVDKLQEGLQTKRFGRRIFFSHEIGSTNSWAKELALLGAEEGTVAIAQTQTAGRGRLDRVWFSPKGGLYFSVVFRPVLTPTQATKLVFVAGLAVAEVLHELYGLKIETKWPNDVLVNGRKVCGILAEMNTAADSVNFVVVGIGVNANFAMKNALPQELWEDATSLENELGRKVQLDTLFRAVVEKLECIYELFIKEGFAPVLREWKKHAGFLGCRVEVISNSEVWVGLALNVEDDGALTIKQEDGTVKHVLVGDVSLRLK
jgi:BirA family biotin operon repressor/biotin-[acetyl-CoA-carboxylase] ligase